MKKFLLLFLIFGLYLSTSAQSIDDLCDALPETAILTMTDYGGPNYLDIEITEGGILNGEYPGWCLASGISINLNILYNVDVYCSYETLPVDLITNTDNVDLVNWLINNVVAGQSSSCGDAYTFTDIQVAVWTLIGDDLSGTPIGSWDQCRVDEILLNAETLGEGYEPGFGDFIAVFLDPVLEVQPVMIPFLIQDPGCTLTQGYWKTHGDPNKPKKYDTTWDAIWGNAFFDSDKTYYQAIREKAKGNAYYILAHQYIAAKLNDLAGADFTDADAAFTAATALFSTYTPNYVKGLKGNNSIRQQFIAAADILADYNEGIIGPGHCDDKSTFATIENSSSDINIYPNPMTNSGTIDFTAENAAQTTVEMFNIMGQKVATLFDSPAQMGQKYQVKIDANKYQKGLYIVYLRNGSSTVTKKININ